MYSLYISSYPSIIVPSSYLNDSIILRISEVRPALSPETESIKDFASSCDCAFPSLIALAYILYASFKLKAFNSAALL